jgi:hypothetical protein
MFNPDLTIPVDEMTLVDQYILMGAVFEKLVMIWWPVILATGVMAVYMHLAERPKKSC